jgi:hypothetical protein
MGHAATVALSKAKWLERHEFSVISFESFQEESIVFLRKNGIAYDEHYIWA